MNKKIGLVLMALLPVLSYAQTNAFTIDGKIVSDSILPGKVYLIGKGVKRDSVLLKNNAYHFSGVLERGGVVSYISWRDRPIERQLKEKGNMLETGSVMVMLAPGAIHLEHQLPFERVQITGSQLQDDRDSIGRVIREHKRPQDAILREYIETHPASWLSYFLLENRRKAFGAATADSLYRGLSTALKANEVVKTLGDEIAASLEAGVGETAPDFTLNDPEGKAVSLASYRGKYVLVDFWASWCAPCRAENPNVQAAYNTYKSKGFDVLSVSLDYPTSKKAWIEAIQKDGLTWQQVSDLKGLDSEAAQKYGVHSIPANFLVDPSGKIVASNLRGVALDKKLAELIK